MKVHNCKKYVRFISVVCGWISLCPFQITSLHRLYLNIEYSVLVGICMEGRFVSELFEHATAATATTARVSMVVLSAVSSHTVSCFKFPFWHEAETYNTEARRCLSDLGRVPRIIT